MAGNDPRYTPEQSPAERPLGVPSVLIFLTLFFATICGIFLTLNKFFIIDWNTWAQPVATLGAGFAAIGAALLTFNNGQKNRLQDLKIHDREQSAETERTLRDRFTEITKLLSDPRDFISREAGVYALVALSDDWAKFYHNDRASSRREQQVCLDVLTGQLRDVMPDALCKEDPVLLTFKHRIQKIIAERYRGKAGRNLTAWTDLDLDLSDCHFHDLDLRETFFRRNCLFSRSVFHGSTLFTYSRFNTRSHFDNTRFIGDVKFRKSTFFKGAIFSKCSFGAKVDFNTVEFHSSGIFSTTNFNNKTDFSGATFGPNSSFENANFRSNSFFNNAKFHNFTSDKGLEDSNVHHSYPEKFEEISSIDDESEGSDIIFYRSNFTNSAEQTGLDLLGLDLTSVDFDVFIPSEDSLDTH
ncbi:pentapeptide repeat-containing protein [Corynebacterium sp. A21]|uniref:pentapeptide repeat-containing protein n=1 Tax=Corynebacterium sp. A21 TaxID=3457318 RepID=UPI003FD3E8F8